MASALSFPAQTGGSRLKDAARPVRFGRGLPRISISAPEGGAFEDLSLIAPGSETRLAMAKSHLSCFSEMMPIEASLCRQELTKLRSSDAGSS